VRRGLGRGRLIVGVGSVLALVGMVLPWVTAGGPELDLPVYTQNGFDGAGILVFVAAIGLLTVIVLPYASPTGRSQLDDPVSFVLLGGAAVTGMVVQVIQLWSAGALVLMPLDRGPGVWVTGIGVALIAWGVGEILTEKPAAR
jgi:hypothetical protein